MPGLPCLHASVLLPPLVLRRQPHFDDAADVDDRLLLGDQPLGRFELADDLLVCLPGAFHGGVRGSVWPDEDFHSPWNGFHCPRQVSSNPRSSATASVH
jgi:hypothetical protein